MIEMKTMGFWLYKYQQTHFVNNRVTWYLLVNRHLQAIRDGDPAIHTFSLDNIACMQRWLTRTDHAWPFSCRGLTEILGSIVLHAAVATSFRRFSGPDYHSESIHTDWLGLNETVSTKALGTG